MGLDDIVSISITSESAHVSQKGFGTPMILSGRPTWAERVRVYTDTSDMVTDGFTALTPEYLAATEIFSQNPRPESVKVGRSAVKATQRFKIVPVVVNSTKYSIRVVGPDGVDHQADYTSDASATAAEIIDNLKIAIDAYALPLTTSNQGPNTSLRALANNAGDFFSLEVLDPSLLLIEQDHADPGFAAELDAIRTADDDWYGLITLFNSTAVVAAVAAWCETKAKIYIAQSQQGDILTGSATDIASTLKTAAYARTATIYHPRTSAFADAAWFGRVLPFDPGSETWAFKTLAGVPVTKLTPTQHQNAIGTQTTSGKSTNTYETIGGVNVTMKGVVAAGEYIDVIRFRDWLAARMQERIFGTLANAKKVPYTDKGVATVLTDVESTLQDGVDAGGLSDDPKPTATAPKVANVSPTDKANRLLPDVVFEGTLAGAIHALKIRGNVSV